MTCEQPRPGTPPLPGRHALLAVAEPLARAVCEAAVADLGMSAEVVRTGVEAVIAARRHTPDAVVVDLQLEDVPGRQAALWLRGNPQLYRCPVVLLVDGARQDAGVAVDAPCRVLHRPVARQALRAVLAVLVRAPGQEGE